MAGRQLASENPDPGGSAHSKRERRGSRPDPRAQEERLGQATVDPGNVPVSMESGICGVLAWEVCGLPGQVDHRAVVAAVAVENHGTMGLGREDGRSKRDAGGEAESFRFEVQQSLRSSVSWMSTVCYRLRALARSVPREADLECLPLFYDWAPLLRDWAPLLRAVFGFTLNCTAP